MTGLEVLSAVFGFLHAMESDRFNPENDWPRLRFNIPRFQDLMAGHFVLRLRSTSREERCGAVTTRTIGNELLTMLRPLVFKVLMRMKDEAQALIEREQAFREDFPPPIVREAS